MRRPTSAWTTAILGTALSASMLSAQQVPAPPANGPGTAPAAASNSMTASRGAHYLIRNGQDFLQLQEYDRALALFREAEQKQSGLSDPEKADLRQGIDEALRGLRDAPSSVQEGAGAAARPGAFASAPPHSRDSVVLASGAAIMTVPSDLPPLPLGPAEAETSPAPIPAGRVPAPQGVTEPPALASGSSPSNDTVEPALPPLPPALTENGNVLAQEPISAPPAPDLPPAAVLEPPGPLPPLPEMAELPPAPPINAPLDAHTTPAAAPPSPAPPPTPDPLPPLPEVSDEPVPTPAPATGPGPEAPQPEPVPTPAPAPVPDPVASAGAGAELPVVVPASAPEMPAPAQAPTAALAPAVPASEAPAPRVIPSSPPPAAVPVPTQAPQPSLPAQAPSPEPQPQPRPVDPAPAPAAAPATPVRPSPSAAVLPGGYDPAQSTLAPHLQREVDQIAQKQEEELRRELAQPRPIPGPDAPMAPPSGVNRSTASQLDISRAPSPTEARPIRAIPVPENFVPMARRDWAPNRKYWSAAAVCHMPLYFQDAALERYGHNVERFAGRAGRYLSYPVDDPRQSNQRNQILQPIFSIGLFAFQTAMLPYNLVMDPPWEAEYDLGYFRPGDHVPSDIIYLPLHGVGPPLQGKNY